MNWDKLGKLLTYFRIELRPSVPEELPAVADFPDLIQIQISNDNSETIGKLDSYAVKNATSDVKAAVGASNK